MMKLWIKILMVILALGILYVSFTRAGLEKVTLDEKYDQLRKIPISYQQKENGNKDCYRLPESRTLPNSPAYLLKKIRDNLWIYFSRNPIDKASISILIADKKIEESITLYNDSKDKNIIIKNIDEAKEKLNLARLVMDQLDQNDLEVKKMKQKIEQANSFYQYIIEQVSSDKKIVRCDE